MSESGDDLAGQAMAVLRAQGERITVPRRLVVEELGKATSHLSAEDLLTRIQRHEPGVHLATVYRTLEALMRSGLAVHVHLPHGATTYHLARPGHRTHLHLACRSCDTVIDVPAETLDGVADDLDRSHGFRLDPPHVALTGWCPDCRPDATPAPDPEN